MTDSNLPHFIFDDIPADQSPYERYAKLINRILSPVEIAVDTFSIEDDPNTPVSIAEVPADPQIIKNMFGKEALTLEPPPYICCRFPASAALEAINRPDEEVMREMEGVILHEAWHMLNPRERVLEALHAYENLLVALHECDHIIALCSTENTNAAIEKIFGSREAFGHMRTDIAITVQKPMENIRSAIEPFIRQDAAQLADSFAQAPDELMPPERLILRTLPNVKQMQAYFGQCNQLYQALETSIEAEKVTPSPHPGFSEGWAANYSRAIEFSNDEFASVNASHPDSMVTYLTNAMKMKRKYDQARLADLLPIEEGKEVPLYIKNLMQGMMSPDDKGIGQISSTKESRHPTFEQRIDRLRTIDRDHSAYRQ